MFDVFLKDNSELLMYLLAAVVFAFLYFLNKKKLKFSFVVLIAMVLGLIAGLVFKEKAAHLKIFGTIYKKLITVIVIPLVSVMIIKSFTQLEDKNALKKIGIKSLFWLLITTAIGAILGILFAEMTNLGAGFDLPKDENPIETFKFVDAILNLIPFNVVEHAANNEVLQVIFFSILVAIAIIIEGVHHPERVKPVKDFVNSAADVMSRVTKMVIKFTPYGVFGLMADVMANNDEKVLKSLAIYGLVIYGVMIVHFLLVHVGLITFVAKLNPFKFFKKVSPAQLVAFNTQSSYGTLPVTIKSLSNVGVSDRVANFVAPLGANMGMNACSGIFPAVVAIVTAHAYKVPLEFNHYLIIVFASVIASIGIAGVPGIAAVVATVVLSSAGLNVNGLLLIIGIDTIVDMGRTCLNVTGSMVAATLVAKSEKELDLDVFNSNVVSDSN